MEIEIKGKSLIGLGRGSATGKTFYAFNPQTGKTIEPDFHSATLDELNQAAGLADEARIPYGSLPGKTRAVFLRQIADNIEALGNTLVGRASLETALPNARFVGERARTCGQLRMFADLLDDGSWVDARIDHAIPDREPIPKPDVRSMLRPLGPVAVFCASNFPLAYSVAGGDTASAFAAGCPVIVIAHTAHPGTAELVGSAVAEAAKQTGMPEGVFSLLFSDGYEIGQALVKHPAIKAVGFTGSRRGGRALMDIAAARKEPIPVYTEMSSVNPTFFLPGAIEKRGDALVMGLYASVTGGTGQFCTKPGLVFLPESVETSAFISNFKSQISNTQPSPLLTAGIQKSYNSASGKREGEVEDFLTNAETDLPGFSVNPSVFETSAIQFLNTPDLNEEIFGPTTLLIKSQSKDDLLKIARSLEGQLTASVHGTEDDLIEYADLIAILETKAGRLIFNGFSTGVEVCPSIVHGGPYPATSDSRSTAVGTRAITRFSRLVCFQNFPDASLPDELKEKNPLNLWRMTDGELKKE
ncbi:MAG TPA: aldehyde dehydrogenase (NADP(+)) [Pyrinomonadaceae bacterium]|jgi:NADP-dependent aldehyde dehydrogenase|nr:aldehyde dehydrogenase (NADP(+)) [Pyrinomonadaceae bacterium]